MNFDYTYIAFRHFLIFEPLIIVSNAILLTICLWCFVQLRKFGQLYPRRMAGFTLWMAISAIFGAISHSVHYQLGAVFFRTAFYFMNAGSLIAIYCCFRASYAYSHSGRTESRWLVYIVKVWVIVLLVLAGVFGNFLLIKIHAGAVMFYALAVHYMMLRRNGWRANKQVMFGILISFLSIVAHTLRFSLHEWFNYKDIAHVFMILGLLFMADGILGISAKLTDERPSRSKVA